jgi:outer membrane protein assembly factor BamB
MRVFYYLFPVFGFICLYSCGSGTSNSADRFLSIEAKQIYKLPGTVAEQYVSLNNGLVYYKAMESNGDYAVKCYSLKKDTLVWSIVIKRTGGYKGVVTSAGEYVLPTSSDSVYVIDPLGNYRILKLEYECMTNPVLYGNTVILQDKGAGLKCFDVRSLQPLWTVEQQGEINMLQVLLRDSNVFHILDNKRIQSVAASSGKLNWTTPLKDSLGSLVIGGSHGNMVFVLSTGVRMPKFITAIDVDNGKQLWRTMVDKEVDVLRSSIVVRDSVLYCKAGKHILTYAVRSGKRLRQYDYKNHTVTSLVVDSSNNILFGLDDKTLRKIDQNGKDTPVAVFKGYIHALYNEGGNTFLYSYPKLYALTNPQ